MDKINTLLQNKGIMQKVKFWRGSKFELKLLGSISKSVIQCIFQYDVIISINLDQSVELRMMPSYPRYRSNQKNNPE